MERRFEDILNECIDQVLQGATVEQCLEAHPDHARELDPLLRVAAASRAASRSIEARPEFRARVRHELGSSAEKKDRTGKKQDSLAALRWMPRWAMAALALVFVLALSGTTVVAASTDTVPGDTLYGVKTTTEDVQMKLTFSERGKASLEARFAQRRAQEMARLAEAGRTQDLQELGTRFKAHLARIEDMAARTKAADGVSEEGLAGLRETLYANMARDQAALDNAEEKAPPRARALVAAARFRLMERYERAIAALDGSAG